MGHLEPLNPNERTKKDDDGLIVRRRIEIIYARRGFDSIDPADLRGRFRWWGLYTQRRPGIDGGRTGMLEPEELDDSYFMMRVRIDGGALSTEQLRVLGEISRLYARDTADITDRQNIQYHWIRIEDVPKIWDKLEKSGQSLTFMAASAGRTDLINRLIEMKVDVNKPVHGPADSAGSGWTPLMIAAAEGRVETVSALVKAGADVNATNGLGRTALMFASSYGFLAIVKDLLDHRADANIVPKDSTGWTALIAAVHNGHLEVTRVLLDHGADSSLRDKQGKTALAWAEAQGHVEVAQALRDATAKK